MSEKQGGGMNEMEVFKELVKREPNILAWPMEKLVPISFIGDAAIAAYRTIIGQLKRMDQLDEQNKKTLRDGQDAGKMQLLIQAAIGTKLRNEIPDSGGSPIQLNVQSPVGMTHRQRTTARTISKHPEAIEEVIKEAEDNEDIPTKTAVLNKIAYKEEKEHKTEEREKSQQEMSVDEIIYLSRLDKAYGVIKSAPKQITEKGFRAIQKSLTNIKLLIEEMIDEGLQKDAFKALPGSGK